MENQEWIHLTKYDLSYASFDAFYKQTPLILKPMSDWIFTGLVLLFEVQASQKVNIQQINNNT